MNRISRITAAPLAAFVSVCLIAGCGSTDASSQGGSVSSSAGESAEYTAVSASSTDSTATAGSAESAADTSDSLSTSSDDLPAGVQQMEELDGVLTSQTSPTHTGTTYEIFVGSFYDSDGDGMGDLNGVTEKLDYINDGDSSTSDDLGCNAIWMMPISESPSYHKYDVTDYESIDPDYGTLDDFDNLLSEAHSRGISVILDMVINHTGSQNQWFKDAVSYLKNLPEGQEPSSDECPYVDYYNFSREQEDGYVPLSGTNWYYEARFSEDMPDLNLDSDAVRQELTDIATFWLNRGVDGFRMDASLYYYTGNNEKSIDFLKWYADMVRGINPDAYIVSEVWTDQSTYSTYYASGIDSCFDFAFATQDGIIAKTVNGFYDAADYVNAQSKEQDLYASYNSNYINAPFYTNHDTARSAGYYAGDDGSKTKMAEGLNLIMSGNAFLYYGEELGMKGSGKDENKRAPMYWSTDSSAEGMCDGPTGMDSIKMKFDSFEKQDSDPSSILSYVRSAIKIRNAFPSVTAGRVMTCDSLSSGSTAVYTKTLDGAETTVIALNTGDTASTLTLDDSTGFAPSDLQISAVLLSGEDMAELSDGQLTLPPYSIVIMTAK
jgi:glycosidase